MVNDEPTPEDVLYTALKQLPCTVKQAYVLLGPRQFYAMFPY